MPIKKEEYSYEVDEAGKKFCGKISNLSGDKIGLVDLIFWRFATLNDNYINLLRSYKK